MIYVIAATNRDVETWRHRAGLPKSHVRYLSGKNACRGIRLEEHEVIRLEGAYLHPQLDDILMALAPCGIRPSRVAVVAVLP